MKGRRRHRWIYPKDAFTPRPAKPARCACGATLHYELRKKKRGAPNQGFYGTTTDDTVVTFPSGERLVNPRVMPPCPVLR